MSDNKKYYFAFSLIENFGPASFQKIKNYFNDLETAWHAPQNELTRAGLTDKAITEITNVRNKIDLEQEFKKIFKQNINILTLEDEAYPKLLREIVNPPFLLYYKGILSDKRDKNGLAIIGTRKMSAYGKLVTEKIVRELTDNNIAVVSGLALGIDASAHDFCLKNKGRAIAVIGSGLNQTVFYPQENWRLAQKIISNGGLILSEYPPHFKAQRHYFPIRNRIVSGICLGTLIIEAPIKSGALLTAKLALEQNREVFAIPGPINSINSRGTHDLIKRGAKLVDCADDILYELNIQPVSLSLKIQAKSYVGTEKIIADFLALNPSKIDDIIRGTKLDSPTVNSTLSLMEITGKIKNLNGVINLTQ